MQTITMTNEQQRDEQLWHLARKRAGFKWSLASYFIVNLMLHAIWFFTTGPSGYYWPLWPMLGWGVGLAFQYFAAYHGSGYFTAEEEYEKLKKQQSR